MIFNANITLEIFIGSSSNFSPINNERYVAVVSFRVFPVFRAFFVFEINIYIFNFKFNMLNKKFNFKQSCIVSSFEFEGFD